MKLDMNKTLKQFLIDYMKDEFENGRDDIKEELDQLSDDEAREWINFYYDFYVALTEETFKMRKNLREYQEKRDNDDIDKFVKHFDEKVLEGLKNVDWDAIEKSMKNQLDLILVEKPQIKGWWHESIK